MKALADKIDAIAKKHGGMALDIFHKPMRPVYLRNAVILYTQNGIVTITHDDDGRICPGRQPISTGIREAEGKVNEAWLYGTPYKMAKGG